METKYCPDDMFVQTIIDLGRGTGAILESVEGHMRWVIHPADGVAYILRPESARDIESGAVTPTEASSARYEKYGDDK